MPEIIDTNKLKKKFGELLSRLYTDSNLSVEEIEEIILNSDYFDFLERNKPKEFLDRSYEEIAMDVFHADTVFSNDLLSEFYWAGEMYISLSLNSLMPLRQIFLLCPLDKMLQYFTVYHEMNEMKLIKKYKDTDYTDSILRKLRKSKDLTVKQLSALTSISEDTLKHYERYNENLFNASYKNITKINAALESSAVYFKKYSDYVPFTYLYFEDQELFKELSAKLDRFYPSDKNPYEFDGMLVKYKNGKKDYYVREAFLLSSIKEIIIEYSKKDILLF